MLDIIAKTYDFEDTAQAELLGGRFMAVYEYSEARAKTDLESQLGDKPSFIATQADAEDFASMLEDLNSVKSKTEAIEVCEVYAQLSYGALSKLAAQLLHSIKTDDVAMTRSILKSIYRAA